MIGLQRELYCENREWKCETRAKPAKPAKPARSLRDTAYLSNYASNDVDMPMLQTARRSF